MKLKGYPGPRPGDWIVSFDGSLDLYHSVLVAHTILEQIDNGARTVVFDCSKLNGLDSSGVGVVIRVMDRLRILSGRLLIAGLSGAPFRVMQMTNLLRLMPVYPDVSAAFQAALEDEA